MAFTFIASLKFPTFQGVQLSNTFNHFLEKHLMEKIPDLIKNIVIKETNNHLKEITESAKKLINAMLQGFFLILSININIGISFSTEISPTPQKSL